MPTFIILGEIPFVFDAYDQASEDAILRSGFYVINEHFNNAGVVYCFNYQNGSQSYSLRIKVGPSGEVLVKTAAGDGVLSGWRQVAFT